MPTQSANQSALATRCRQHMGSSNATPAGRPANLSNQLNEKARGPKKVNVQPSRGPEKVIVQPARGDGVRMVPSFKQQQKALAVFTGFSHRVVLSVSFGSTNMTGYVGTVQCAPRRNNSVVLECWLQERLKPKWSLGCAACAQLLARASLAKENSARHLRRRFSTKWARFEITALSQMQSCSFAQHAATSVHKLAVKSLREPDLPLVALLPECEDDTSLLRGCVPQPEDFLKAWRCVKSPVSFSKASMQSHMDFFITGHQRAEGGIERRLLLPDSVSHVVCMCSLFVGSVILENSPRNPLKPMIFWFGSRI